MHNTTLRSTLFRLFLLVAGVVLLVQPRGSFAAPTPNPSVSLGVPTEGFIGEPISFPLTFDNSDATGYGPYVDLFLPESGIDGTASSGENDGITFGGASFLGANVNSTVIECAAGTTLPQAHPLTGEDITCPAAPGGYTGPSPYMWQLVVLELPFGSFTINQPAAVITIDAELSDHADLDQPLPIMATPNFRFGADPLDNADDDPPIHAAPVSATFTPKLFTLSKAYLGPEDETATGPHYPRQYQLTVDIADGQTIDNLQIKDILPDNLAYLQFDSGDSSGFCSPSTEPVAGVAHDPADNTVIFDCGSVTGTEAADDAVVTYTFFVPRPDAADDPVIDPESGDDVESIDDASAGGNWTPIDPRDSTIPVLSDLTPEDHTLTDKSIAIQKGVEDITNTIPRPGDTLEYTLDFQVSDFFAFQNIVIDDITSDGQRFDTTFTPTLLINGNTYTLTAADFDSANFNVYDRFNGGLDNDPDHSGLTDGTQRLVFRVSDEIITRGQNGLMIGGCVPTTGTGTGNLPNCDTETGGYNDGHGTTGKIVFRTVVQQVFTDDFGAGDPFVDQGDTLNDDVVISGDNLNVEDLS